MSKKKPRTKPPDPSSPPTVVFCQSYIIDGERTQYRVQVFNLLDECLYDTLECYHSADAESRVHKWCLENNCQIVMNARTERIET